jgi:hypothetical protein
VVGLTILAVVAVYIGIVWALVRFALKNNWARAAVVLAALAIPFWDLPIGYHNYQKHCLNEGGIRIKESFPPQTSIYFLTPTGFRPEILLKMGYETIEYKTSKSDVVQRFVRSKGDGLQRAEAAIANSALRLRSDYNTKLSWNLYRQQELLEDNRSGKLIAQATKFVWHGGWLHTLLPSGPAAVCHAESLNEIVALIPNGAAQVGPSR